MANRTNRPQKKEETVDKEQRAFKLSVKGWSQINIAKHMGVSQQGVSVLLKRATEKFTKNFLEDMKIIKHGQVAQLENAAHEAIKAWYKSKSKGGYTEKTPHGDPRFLTEFRKAKEDVRKILGLDSIDLNINSDSEITEVKISLITPEDLQENEN